MRSNNKLFNLIKSLNAAECGYFRKYASRHTIGDRNIYLRLFDLIQQNKKGNEIDDAELKGKLKSFTNIGNFSVLKNYLYEMILRSMRMFNENKEVDNQINSHIDNYLFLKNKNLDDESEAELRKAKKLAAEHERYEKLLEISKKEAAIVRKNSPVDVKALTEKYEELKSINEKLMCNSQYRHLNDIAFAKLHKDGKNIKLIEKNFRQILTNPLMQDVNKAITYESKLAFYQIHSAHYHALSNYPKTLEMYESILKVMNDHPSFKKEFARGYLIILHNCTDVCELMQDEKGTEKYYKMISDFIENPNNMMSEEIRNFHFSNFAISRLVNLIVAGKYDKENTEVHNIEKQFIESIEKVAPGTSISLMFQLTIYYFGCGDYDSSLKWLNKIVNKDEELRSDLRIESKLLFLIIHLELNNYDLIDHALKSTKRYLQKKEPLMGMEPVILKFINKISNIRDPSNMKKLYVELKDNLFKIKNVVEGYAFDYLVWVESKTSNRSFAEIKREKFLKSRRNVRCEM